MTSELRSISNSILTEKTFTYHHVMRKFHETFVRDERLRKFLLSDFINLNVQSRYVSKYQSQIFDHGCDYPFDNRHEFLPLNIMADDIDIFCIRDITKMNLWHDIALDMLMNNPFITDDMLNELPEDALEVYITKGRPKNNPKITFENIINLANTHQFGIKYNGNNWTFQNKATNLLGQVPIVYILRHESVRWSDVVDKIDKSKWLYFASNPNMTTKIFSDNLDIFDNPKGHVILAHNPYFTLEDIIDIDRLDVVMRRRHSIRHLDMIDSYIQKGYINSRANVFNLPLNDESTDDVPVKYYIDGPDVSFEKAFDMLLKLFEQFNEEEDDDDEDYNEADDLEIRSQDYLADIDFIRYEEDLIQHPVGSASVPTDLGFCDRDEYDIAMMSYGYQLKCLFQKVAGKCPVKLLKMYQDKQELQNDLIRPYFNHWLYRPGSFMSKKIQAHFENHVK